MDQQTHSGDQQLQQSSQVEADQQTVDEERKGCWNILKLWRDPIACIKSKDLKSVVKPSNIKNNIKRVAKWSVKSKN